MLPALASTALQIRAISLGKSGSRHPPTTRKGTVLSDPDDSTGAMLRDTTARIFADLADPQILNAAADTAWKAPLWAALEQAGLTLAWVSEANGGAGATTLDGFEILRVSGQYAAPVAIAETLLAGRFLDAAGLTCPSGPLAVAPLRLGDQFTCARDGTISGAARAVPHIRDARACTARTRSASCGR